MYCTPPNLETWLRAWPGVWKRISTGKPPCNAHANTHWKNALVLPGVWKKIFACQQPENAYANTYRRKTWQFPGVWIRFAPTGHLTVHMRTHKKEKVYCCQDCGKRFSKSTSLTKSTSPLNQSHANTYWRKTQVHQPTQPITCEPYCSTNHMRTL